MLTLKQRYWKWLFCFPNFGLFCDVSGYPYCRLIISCQNFSKNENISDTRLGTTLHHCRLILETEMESGTKSRFHYLCPQVTLYKSSCFVVTSFLCIFTIYVHFALLKPNLFCIRTKFLTYNIQFFWNPQKMFFIKNVVHQTMQKHWVWEFF